MLLGSSGRAPGHLLTAPEAIGSAPSSSEPCRWRERGAVLGLRMPFVTLHVRCMAFFLSLRRRNGIHNQPAPRSGLQTRSSRRPFKCHRNCRSEGCQLALHCIPLFRAVSPPKVGLCTTPRAVAALKLQFSRLRKNSPPLTPIVPACHSDPATSSERSEGSGNRRLIECK